MAEKAVDGESNLQQMAECSTAQGVTMPHRTDANKICKTSLKTIFRMP
jgi:hypothetical protein